MSTPPRILNMDGTLTPEAIALGYRLLPSELMPFDFEAHLQRQREWSERTFGPGPRAAGVVDHIRKELREIEAKPTDLSEWIDVVILALDGAWRSGATPQQIIDALVAKQAKNEARDWPDWRTQSPDKAIEHDRSKDPPKVKTCNMHTDCDKADLLSEPGRTAHCHSDDCEDCFGK